MCQKDKSIITRIETDIIVSTSIRNKRQKDKSIITRIETFTKALEDINKPSQKDKSIITRIETTKRHVTRKSTRGSKRQIHHNKD